MWADYLAAKLGPQIALFALKHGGVTVTKSELLQKVKDGGAALYDSRQAALVAHYEAALGKGDQVIAAALRKAGRRASRKDVVLVQTCGQDLVHLALKGVSWGDVYQIADLISERAVELGRAVRRLKSTGRQK